MPTRFRQNPRTAGRVNDGQAVVITPGDNKMHTLNAAGSRIWVLAENGCTLDEVTGALHQTFRVDEERARADARAFLADLVRRGVLVVDEERE